MTEEYAKIQKEYYEKGAAEGREKAKEESYNSGFRDGVQRGIEVGLLQEFLMTMKNLMMNKEEFAKVVSMIDKCNFEDYDDLQNKTKAVKANYKLIMKKKEKK